MPERVQLSRRKGWRMPANTVSVVRPGRLGNPFTVAAAIDSGYATKENAGAFVVECFRDWLTQRSKANADWWTGPESDRRRAEIIGLLGDLRGKNLACWCPLGRPCHADVLLELANGR